MYFRHAPQIWNDFPQLAAGVLVLTDINPDVQVQSTVESGFQRARELLRVSAEGQMPEIAAWRKTYAQMGLKPTKYRCAAESLLRRFRKEGALPSFHPLVDLCNALSLAYAMPIAVYDIDAIVSGIEVRYATSSEEHLNFSDHIEHPEPNEVVFVDQQDHAHSRRWCFRQSKYSIVSPVTTRALIVAEGQHTGAEGDIFSLLDELSEACTHHWRKPALREQLSEHSPEALFGALSE